eukprot:gene8405-10322_t
MTIEQKLDGATTTTTTKKIFLIRHGQSTYNAAALANGGKDPYLFDARLTELGISQAEGLGDVIRDNLQDVQLIVSSPMTRALDTTRRGFAALIKEGKVPLEVIPYHSESLISSDDNGRPKSVVSLEFPEFNFDRFVLEERWWYVPDHLKSDLSIDSEEYFKTVGYKESEEHLLNRINTFKQWLLARPEQVIAVVGHSDFFYHLFEKKLPYFKNCQVLQWNIIENTTSYITN